MTNKLKAKFEKVELRKEGDITGNLGAIDKK